MTDAEIIWALHKRSQANMSPANSAMAMISISMAGEVQSPSTSANILGSTKCNSSDISGDMSMMNSMRSLFIAMVFTCFYQILFWVVESRQFLAQTNALLQVFFWDKCLVCFLAFWQPSILRIQSFVVASWIKRVPVTTPEKLWWKDVEGSVMIIRKANLSPNKTYLQDNTSYFISNYISDVIISDLSALKNWKPTQQAFHSAKFLRECLRRFTSSTPLQCHFSSI